MKTHLFFFSSTGNSLIVAKDIAAKLPDTHIFSIPNIINEEIPTDADTIGIIFPVYYLGMPRMVADFIHKIELSKAKYIFAICTCGAVPAGTLLQTEKQLKAKGLTLNAGFSIQMPGNYIVRYGASDKRQKEKFIKEKEKVTTIVKTVAKRQDTKIERSNFLLNAIGDFAYRMMLPKFPTLDRNFSVNEKCNHCNICQKVCPVQNIKMIDAKPNWQGNCEHCLACIQWCPTEAIQYGVETNGRKRYHHPEIQATELYRKG